jgi:hypothetical protein
VAVTTSEVEIARQLGKLEAERAEQIRVNEKIDLRLEEMEKCLQIINRKMSEQSGAGKMLLLLGGAFGTIFGGAAAAAWHWIVTGKS